MLPVFGDPRVGGVQVGVRINNRDVSTLARMQDLEFVIFTDVFQRARRHLGSVGLGGNGQFMRLAALMSLGPTPWSDSLTEDLDLGVRLLAGGWRNEYCNGAAVHQQGVVRLGRLIRQRTRWFQGHLQSWALIPLVVRRLPGVARRDVLYHLTAPLLILLASFLTLAFVIGAVGVAMAAVTGGTVVGTWALWAYLLACAPALAFGHVYWTRERRNGLSWPRAALLAHGYVIYALIWYLAGARATWRMIIGETAWAKTERQDEAPQPVSVAQSAALSSASAFPSTQGALPTPPRYEAS